MSLSKNAGATPNAGSVSSIGSIGSIGPIGIVANPASGKDVRRLVARASVFDNQEKQAIVGRAVIGAVAAGATEFVYLNDRHGIVANALAEHPHVNARAILEGDTMTALDTISAARAMQEAGCSVVMTLGGDGTNRAFTLGWPDAPLIPISTGTNNVFPNMGEATVAGAAAGIIASGLVSVAEVSRAHKLIEVSIDGQRDDLALIDAVLTRERFVGARALLSPDQLAAILLTRADPASVGMAAVGGLIQPVKHSSNKALLIKLCGGNEAQIKQKTKHTIKAPIAPGLYTDLHIEDIDVIGLDKPVVWHGPGVLAFDGERERTLLPDQYATLKVTRNGPKVIRISKVMRKAAAKGCFVT